MRKHGILWSAVAAALACARLAAQVADRDHDGTADAVDLCPDSAEPAADAYPGDGCPALDPDSDGVATDYDVCPDAAETVNGFEDADGCPDTLDAQVHQSADRILFATGSDALTASARATVGDVARLVSSHAEIGRVRVEGHADARGDAVANLALSGRRARSVRDALVAAGVPAGRVDAVGLGALSGDSAEIQAANRRVDLLVSLTADPRDSADLGASAGTWVGPWADLEVGRRARQSALVVKTGAPAWLGPPGSRLPCYAARVVGDRLVLHCAGVGVDATAIASRRGAVAVGLIVGRRGSSSEHMPWSATEVRVASAVAPPSGCTTAALGDRVFAFCPTSRPWGDAAAACASSGWRLATIDAPDENGLVVSQVAGGAWWIGASDGDAEGAWRWQDGSVVAWAAWGAGEPNDSAPGEDCALVAQAGWNDGTCDTPLPFVCEHPAGAAVPIGTYHALRAREGRTSIARSDVHLATRDWEPTATVIDASTAGPFVLPAGQRIVLAGTASGSSAWHVDNFVLVEVLDPAGRRVGAARAGQAEPTTIDGVSVAALGAPTFDPGPVDITSLVPANGAPFLLRVSALDYGGGANVGDVWVVSGAGAAPTCDVSGDWTGTATRASDGSLLLVTASLRHANGRVTASVSYASTGISVGEQELEGTMDCGSGALVLTHASGTRMDGGLRLHVDLRARELAGRGSDGAITDITMAGGDPPTDEETTEESSPLF